MASRCSEGALSHAQDPARNRHLSFLATAFVLGTPLLPLSSVPFQELVDRAEAGRYRARPAHVFEFEDIVAAHALMESRRARRKIVVRGARDPF